MAKNKQSAPETPKQRPAHEIRFGRLKLTIWKQESDKGPWFSVVPTRSYRDAQGNWRSSQSFGLDDLLLLAKLCDLADTWIRRERIKDNQNGQDAETPPQLTDEPF
jgi:hypothetical protein